MWNWFISKSVEVISYTVDFLSYTVALIFLLGAIAFYVYTAFDRRIPRFIIPPVVCVLACLSVAIYVFLTTHDYDKRQCDLRFQTEQDRVNRDAMQAAIDIGKVKDELAKTRIDLAASQAAQRLSLDAAIDEELKPHPVETPDTTPPDFQPILPEESAANVPTPNQKPVVIRPSCLTERVPTNILRAINGQSGNSTKPASR